MATNFKEMLPQERGTIVVNSEVNRLPDGSSEQNELLKIRNAGLNVSDNINSIPNNGNFPPQRPPGTKRNKKLLPAQ